MGKFFFFFSSSIVMEGTLAFVLFLLFSSRARQTDTRTTTSLHYEKVVVGQMSLGEIANPEP